MNRDDFRWPESEMAPFAARFHQDLIGHGNGWYSAGPDAGVYFREWPAEHTFNFHTEHQGWGHYYRSPFASLSLTDLFIGAFYADGPLPRVSQRMARLARLTEAEAMAEITITMLTREEPAPLQTYHMTP